MHKGHDVKLYMETTLAISVEPQDDGNLKMLYPPMIIDGKSEELYCRTCETLIVLKDDWEII